MSPRGRHVTRSNVRLAASRAVLVLAAVAILLAVVRGGTRFFYCPMTHLVFDAPPCASPADETDADASDAPAGRTADCCQEKWRAAAPTASVPDLQGPSVMRAGVVALLPGPHREIAMASATMPFGVARAVRAGPPPPSASERRAQLMVFHI